MKHNRRCRRAVNPVAALVGPLPDTRVGEPIVTKLSDRKEKLMKMISTLVLLAVLLTGTFAQRPRSMDPEPAKTQTTASAPKTMKAKYEGGVFGYRKTMEGTLTFDDDNKRLIFKDKKPPKEIHIPYDAITSVFADTQKRRPAAATVAGQVPLIYVPNPIGFIKTKVRYLTLQYSDPDSNVSGVTSFKLENKELLESVVKVLAEKTGMVMRGDIYVRKRPEDAVKTTPNQ